MDREVTPLDLGEDETARSKIEQALLAERLLWLDMDIGESEVGTISALLREVFEIHQLVISDVEHFNRRPKISEYGDYVQIVGYLMASRDEPLIEVHFLYCDRYLITLHRGECTPLTELAENLPPQYRKDVSPRLVTLYRVLETMTDSYFPVLSDFDDRIDQIQDAILARATTEQLGELSQMKRWLVGVRKIVTAQRDLFAKITAGAVDLPGIDEEAERYYRDLYDQQIRISDLVDSYRDLLTDCMDVYLSVVSNRLNTVMKQLTIVATFFLPLSFLSSFFGQNFSWLTDHIGGFGVFLIFGIGLEVLAGLGLLGWLRHKRWL